jgi:hypothetical protein
MSLEPNGRMASCFFRFGDLVPPTCPRPEAELRLSWIREASVPLTGASSHSAEIRGSLSGPRTFPVLAFVKVELKWGRAEGDMSGSAFGNVTFVPN